MPIHLYNLLVRSFFAVPTALGSTWLGLLFPLCGFIVAQIVIVATGGFTAMKNHWRQNLIKGFAVAGIAWACLFLWCVVATTYADHAVLAARTQTLSQNLLASDQIKKNAVQAVTSSLGSQLAEEKERCAKLEGANGVLNKQNSDQQETINHCQEDAIKLLTPIEQKTTVLFFDKDEKANPTKARFLLLTNKSVTPVDMNVQCNFAISEASVYPIPIVMHTGGQQRLNSTTWQTSVGDHAWTPESPLMAEVSYFHGGDIACSFILR